MRAADEFDDWAASGRDRGMEERHWHTAKHILARMPIEPGEVVLDLGTGSGYALRALADARAIGRGYGLDGSPRMLRNAAGYTDDATVGFVAGDFDALPFADGRVDHVFSMEAFYYAADPVHTVEEVARVLRPGGTFHCGVNYFAESEHTHGWQDDIGLEMTLWDRAEYREAFRAGGLHVAAQDTIPDREVDIPPAEAFPTEDWERRADMVDRYRTWGTLLTVGVAP
ncbi:MAG: methyltransferase domain-containing protein [Halobacteriales archaeon]